MKKNSSNLLYRVVLVMHVISEEAVGKISKYRGSLAYVNFTTVIFKNIPEIWSNNRSSEGISPKITLAKCLTDAKFGQCYFFPKPKVE
jgi:hypothetical protein